MKSGLVPNPERVDVGDTTPFRLVAVMILVAASLAINLAILARDGIRRGNDTERYLVGAERLIQGRPLGEKPFSSVGYAGVVAVSRLAGAGLAGVVVVQLAAAALAVVAQYDLGRRLGGRRAGVIAAGLLAANPDLARWHAYLLTDSLYTSLVVLATWGIHRATEEQGAWRYISAAGLVLLAALLRPEGWLMVPIAGAYWVGLSSATPWTRRLGLAAVVFALVMCVWAIAGFRHEDRLEPPDVMLYRGQVVGKYDDARIPMPEPSTTIGRGWSAAWEYAAQHPAASLRLAALRVVAELAHVRPFYSSRHNLFLLACLPLLYVLALIGLVRARPNPLAVLLAAVIMGHFLIVALTCADWDGRFLLYAMPAIVVLAAHSLAAVRLRLDLIVILAITALALTSVSRPLLVGFARMFRVNEPRPCDALVVLLGSERDRPERAAELYQQGLAPILLIGSDSDTNMNLGNLTRGGVPAEAIRVLPGTVVSTHDEALRVRDYARAHALRRLTIVTTSYHTARASRIFRRVLKGTGVEIRVAASTDPRFDESDWYTKEEGIYAYCGETFKAIYSRLAH